jgi:hypothetical protein
MNLHLSVTSVVSVALLTLIPLWHYTYRSTFVENPLQIHLFLQNKPNFVRFWPKNLDLEKKQTQFKPKQSQFLAYVIAQGFLIL